MLCCLRVWHRVPAQQEKEGEKARLELEPLQLEGCVVWPLLYAGLGKTRECGASEVSGLPHQDTSSTMNLFLFKKDFLLFIFLCWKRPILTSFFLLPPLFIFFSFVQKRAYFFFFCFVWQRNERKIYMFGLYRTWLCCVLPFLSFLAVFLYCSHMLEGKNSLSMVWQYDCSKYILGEIPSSIHK